MLLNALFHKIYLELCIKRIMQIKREWGKTDKARLRIATATVADRRRVS